MNEKRLDLAMEAAGLDLWENNLITGEVTLKATKIFAELGYSQEETHSHIDDLFSLVHPDDVDHVKAALTDHLSGRTPRYICEFRLRAKNGQWVWYANHGRIMDDDNDQRGDRFIGVTFNIHDRKTKELERDALVRALKILSACSTVLIHSDSERVFLEAICKLAVDTAGYRMAWIGFAEHDETHSVSCLVHAGFDDGYLDTQEITWSDNASGNGPIGRAIKTGLTVINQDYMTNPSMAPWRDAALKRGYGASIALPLKVKQQVIGTLSIYASDAFSFNEAEVQLLEELANNLSFGMGTLRTRAENQKTQIALRKEYEKNLALLHNASDGIHILNTEGNLIEASDSFCTMLGYTRDEIIGMHVSQWDAHLSEADLAKNLKNQLQEGLFSQFETRHKRKDGSVFNVEISGYTLRLDNQLVIFNSSRDITDRKIIEESFRKKQQQLIESETHYRELLKNLRIAIVVHKPNTKIIYCNPRATELLGLSEEQMRGKAAIDPAWCFINEQEQSMPLDEYPVNRVLADLKPLQGLVLGVKTPGSDQVVWLLVNGFPEFGSDGQLKQIVVNFDDISGRKQAEQRIHSLAFFDALTSLPNRRMLMDRLHSALSTSARSNLYGAVLLIDLDKFKTVNDALGHNFGDLLLIDVAQRLQSCVSDVDTVARIGSDEFVVLLTEIDDQVDVASQKAALVAEKIRLSLNNPFQLDDTEQHSSTSIGVSLYQGNDESPEVLIRQADMAMYKAKDAGRNTLRFFNPAMQLAVETHAAMEADLRHAVPDQQLHLHYQIQVDNETHVIGVEALVRWIHPQRGLVSPLQFITIAEESSLILDIGNWVLNTACRQLAEWSASQHTSSLTMAVNVSAQQFKQPDFVEMIALALSEHRIEPSLLKLELTESVVLNDVEDVVAKMHRLKKLGVTLSMDDFGTGYSSLSYLKLLPLDQLKIDQSFVRDISTDPNDAVMVKTIIDMAKNFRLQVIAEGVETESQLDFLKRHGCMAYQGYLFSKPVPINAVSELLERDRVNRAEMGTLPQSGA